MIARRNKRNALAENHDKNMDFSKNQNPTKRSKKSGGDVGPTFPSNIFTRLVSEAGVAFSLKGNKINTDPITFCQKLNKSIEMRDGNVNETIESFANALEESIEDEKVLICCLMPTELSVELDELGLTSSQVPNSVQVCLMF